MAIQVTGFFQNPINEQMFKDPILVLIPHLVAWGKILLDVNILNGNEEIMGSFNIDINKDNLSYPENMGNDCYANLLSAIQSNIIALLPTTNDINNNAKYSIYIKNPS